VRIKNTRKNRAIDPAAVGAQRNYLGPKNLRELIAKSNQGRSL